MAAPATRKVSENAHQRVHRLIQKMNDDLIDPGSSAQIEARDNGKITSLVYTGDENGDAYQEATLFAATADELMKYLEASPLTRLLMIAESGNV